MTRTEVEELLRLTNHAPFQFRVMVERGPALCRALITAMDHLFHMNWCAQCAKGDWDDCEEGKKAKEFLEKWRGK